MRVEITLRLTGGAKPIFPKQHRFDPAIWKTCLAVTYRTPAKKYAQTTPSVDGVSSFLSYLFILFV
jgi:hypothetical protein